MSANDLEKRAMSQHSPLPGALKRVGRLPTLLLFGSVAVLGLVASASAGEDESSAEDESTASTT